MNNFTSTPQFESGDNVAVYLDIFFRVRGFTIGKTTPYQERVLCLGDRIFTKGDKSFYVEYKSGIQTAQTGNVFLETISVDTVCDPGWVYSSQADYILYAALLNLKILVFKPEKLRSEIGHLRKEFEIKKTDKQNQNYHTHGVIVPLGYAEVHLAHKVIEL